MALYYKRVKVATRRTLRKHAGLSWSASSTLTGLEIVHSACDQPASDNMSNAPSSNFKASDIVAERAPFRSDRNDV